MENLCFWCKRKFAILVSILAPEFCVRHLTVKKWKNGKKNRFAFYFLPSDFYQAKVAHDLTTKELEQRIWSSGAICSMLMDPDRNFTADELININRVEDCEANYFTCFFQALLMVESSSIFWDISLFDYPKEYFTTILSEREILGYKWTEYVPNLIKSVLQVMDDERMGINDEDYNKWLKSACSWMWALKDFLQENEACANQLRNNPRWDVLKKTLDNYLKLEHCKTKEIMEQIAQLSDEKQKELLQTFLHSYWYGDESLGRAQYRDPDVVSAILRVM